MKHTALFAGCLCALAFSLSAPAQVLMLDFGPTPATGTDRLNSPYHTANTSFSDTSWNTLGVTDALSGLVFSNNSAATGVSVNIGATTGTGTVLGLGNTPSGTTLTGSALGAGVYAGTAPGRDGIFTGSSGNSRAVGVQIGGLSAGTYDIYITGRNTNTSAGLVQNFHAAVSPSSGDFDFTGSEFSHKTLTYFASPTIQNDAWSATTTANYVVFSVTLTGSQFVNLAVNGGTGELRGFLNTVQIVQTSSVPEPATAGLLSGLAALVATIGLRRRS
jgi:hypothetical protein